MTIEEVELKLIELLGEVKAAKAELCKHLGLDADTIDIYTALYDVYNIESEHPSDLFDLNLTADKIIEKLTDYKFIDTNIQVLGEVDLSGLELHGLLQEQQLKVNNGIWRIHKNDEDYFPSSPHAHNKETGVSLHLGTGEYFKKRKSLGFIQCKTLEIIRGKVNTDILGVALPILGERCRK